MALSGDGNTAIIGGMHDNESASSYTGAAWVFTRSSSAWSQQGSKLVGTDAIGLAWQGWSVGMSADGNTAVSGGPYDRCTAGAAWVFTRSGGAWSQQGGKLAGMGAAGFAFQGSSVALSADGSTVAVGGQRDTPLDNANTQSGVGAVWLFNRSVDAWPQTGDKLVGSNALGNAGQGSSVALSPRIGAL